MNATEQQRQHYLQQLGVTLWQPRLENLQHDQAVPEAETELAQTGRLAQWDALNEEIRSCQRCDLCHTRTQAVPGVGNHRTRLLVVGEAPGADEDRQGEPFVGRAGQLLNEMLFAIGFRREDIFIANILKCRPPENRDPKQEEIAACHDYLQRQIELINPELILSVGRISAQSLLNSQEAVSRLRGQVHTVGHIAAPVVVTYHPAYLLRAPNEKRKTWSDLLLAQQVLQGQH